MFNRLDQLVQAAHQGLVNLTGIEPFSLREQCLWAIAAFSVIDLALRWHASPGWACVIFVANGVILAAALAMHRLVGNSSLPPNAHADWRPLLWLLVASDLLAGNLGSGAAIAAAASFYYFLCCAPPPPPKRTAGRMAPSGA